MENKCMRKREERETEVVTLQRHNLLVAIATSSGAASLQTPDTQASQISLKATLAAAHQQTRVDWEFDDIRYQQD